MRELDWTAYDVMVVDDEADNLDAFRFAFRKSFRLHYAQSGDDALARLDELAPLVVVSDQRMPKMSGIELLGEVKRRQPDTYAILLTAYADLEVLIDAVNGGAVDRYVQKPWDSKELAMILRQGIDHAVTLRDNRRLREQLAQYAGYLERQQRDPIDFGELVGESAEMAAVAARVEEVAPTGSVVLIEGEVGLESDVVARALHVGSPREKQPFVSVTCAAFPGEALERELFGYVAGSAPGAFADRAGRIELADRGTLYLREPSELTPAVQARLLRWLEYGEVERVGETQARAVDVRLIVSAAPALDKDILPALRSRLSVFPIRLEPLRARRPDIRPLAEHFLRKYAQRNARAATQISAAAVTQLKAYDWPGNVRELENVVERAAILARGDVIEPEHLSFKSAAPAAPPVEAADGVSLSTKLDAIERRELLAALDKHAGNKAEVARSLGIHRTTLYYRLKKLGIDA